MNPALMMMLASLVSGGVGALKGNKAEKGSTYGKGALSLIDQIQQQIKGGVGGPNQDITQSQPYQQGNDFFSSLFNDPEFFNKFEAPAFRQFNEDIAPGLANRYASMGSGGSTGSTGFRNQLAREGGNLATNLSAQRGQMQQNAVPQMLGYAQQPVSNWMTMLQNALTPTQNTYQGPSAGGFRFFGGSICSRCSKYLGATGWTNCGSIPRHILIKGVTYGFNTSFRKNPFRCHWKRCWARSTGCFTWCRATRISTWSRVKCY